MNFSFFTVDLKNRNISSKIKRSKVTDYAALSVHVMEVVSKFKIYHAKAAVQKKPP